MEQKDFYIALFLHLATKLLWAELLCLLGFGSVVVVSDSDDEEAEEEEDGVEAVVAEAAVGRKRLRGGTTSD